MAYGYYAKQRIRAQCGYTVAAPRADYQARQPNTSRASPRDTASSPRPRSRLDPLDGFGRFQPATTPPLSKFQEAWLARLPPSIGWVAFEATVKDLTRALKPSKPPAPGRGRGRAHQQSNAAAAKRIQRLYRKNRRRAMREVSQEKWPVCKIPVDEVFAYFEDVFSERLSSLTEPPEGTVLPTTQQPEASLVAKITREEIVAKLKRTSNTTPGLDGIRYGDLKRRDPGAFLLERVYNICLRHKRIPAAWKVTRTILLHKKGDRGDLDNWRPIAVPSCLYKGFSVVLADRLGRWAARTGAVSRCQKGFVHAEGCLEHNFLLQQCLDDAKNSSRQIVVTWLDLRNAFGSAPHAALLHLLQHHGVHRDLVDVIRDAYDGGTTTIAVAGGVTRAVPIASGVKQGDPLSPVVINLLIEVLIRTIQALGDSHGYRLHGHSIAVLGYADDLVLTASSTSSMQKFLDAVGRTASWIGLQFNAAKCATLHVLKQKVQLATRTSIQKLAIPTLGEGDAYLHLGVPTGLRIDQTPAATIQAMLKDVRAIECSLLSDWQKLDALRTFVVPRVQFSLLTACVGKEAFAKLDRELERVAKEVMHLPKHASTEPVYLASSQGGANLLPLGDLADIGAVVHAFKVLTCPDSVVKEIAEASAKVTVARLIGHQPTLAEVAEVLSGAPTARGVHHADNIWSAALIATRRLANNKIEGFKWGWCTTSERLQVSIPGKKMNEIILDDASRHLLHHKLRQGLQRHYLEQLICRPDEGKVYDAASRDPASNYFYGAAGQWMRFCDWRFIHRARLNALPLHGCVPGVAGRGRSCRACGHPNETVAHVLNHCVKRHCVTIDNRHRAILRDVLEAMPEAIRRNVRVERTIAGSGSNSKPDIVLVDEDAGEAIIVAICCPYDDRYHALQVARQKKEAKYQHLVDHLRGRGLAASVAALVVGSLGSWDPANDRVLARLGVPANEVKPLKRKCVSDVIRWSRDVYVEHVSMRRQYRRNVILPSL